MWVSQHALTAPFPGKDKTWVRTVPPHHVLGLCLTQCHFPRTMAILASDVACWWDLGVWHYPVLFPASLPAEFEPGLGSKPPRLGNPQTHIGG